MKTRVMLIGLGDLGGILLELLATRFSSMEIVVGARRPHVAERRCNIARLGARSRGNDVEIRVIYLDLDRVEETAATIHREQPTILLSTATLSTWWHGDVLPAKQVAEIEAAGFGVWLSVHLLPTLKLMRAVRLAAYAGFTLTAPFPDVVNHVLGKVGLAPTCGIGNIAEIIPKLQFMAAEKLGCPADKVSVTLVGHHALGNFAFQENAETTTRETPPFLLKVEHDGVDVTEAVNGCELMFAPFPLTAGRATHFLTSNTAVALIEALLRPVPTPSHVPGPQGLPGGYPVMASSAGVCLNLNGFSADEAIAVNEASHRFDGIERVEADGTAIVCEENAGRIYRAIGYRPQKIGIENVEEQARDLMNCFHTFCERHGAKQS